jgi:glycosyltransferase involved in cell wall biosynthesis
VARFDEVKGHTYLVRACRILRDRGIAFECRLIGDGPLLRTIEAQIKQAGLHEEIQLLGPCGYQDVIHELSETDVVVLPTAPTEAGNREGMPTVLQEAMACGLPVVASDVGGIPELVDDKRTGLLVPPRNAAALADALQLLRDDPALRLQLGRAGRDKIVREFNLKVNTAKRAKLFVGSASVARSLSGLDLARRSVT